MSDLIKSDLPRPEDDSSSDVLIGGGELGARMRALDWSKTPLGSVKHWPQALKTCIRILLASRQPMWLGWGEQLIFLYNDPYKSIIGGKHPWALGRPTAEVWQEIWDEVGPRIQTTMEGREGTYDEALLLIMERNGYPEETYYTFSYSPVPDDQGGVGGLFCANSDDTKRIISERQLALLRELAAETAEARTVDEACRASSLSLETNPRDIPFALLYRIDEEGNRGVLAGAANVSAGDRVAPHQIVLDSSAIWPLASVLRSNRPQLISSSAKPLCGMTLPSGAWDRPPSQAIALPISTSGQHTPNYVLIAGLNPYRLLDSEYQGFLSLMAGQIGATIANAQAYEDERRRAEALAELDRAKTLFFSNVSHELRTPLTLLLGPLTDALDSPHPALNGEDLLMVRRNGLRLLRLVNTLLDFSRIEAGRVEAAYEPTDVAALTVDLASTFRSAIERAGLVLSVDCPPLPEEVEVYVDREMWEKIVLNLISNAVKHTFTGEIAIALQLSNDGRSIELSVHDTGVGIPTDELPHIFERFHRVPGTRARTHEGTGIGLALVQELVRLHGGTVGVESVAGEGSTFTVTLPSGSGHLPAERIRAARGLDSTATHLSSFVDEAMRWLPSDKEVTHSISGEIWPDVDTDSTSHRFRDAETPLVLLADDNADMRAYVTRLLARKYRIRAVGDGETALEAALAKKPDLILTDVMMPKLDGFGLLRALRADPGTREIPVILLSARAGEEAQVEGLEAGADDYLPKPFSSRELLARVDARIELARVRREKADIERQARLAAESQRERLNELLMQAPAIVCVLRGPDHVFELANSHYLNLVGHRDIIGKPLREALPEIAWRGFIDILDEVYRTGEPYFGNEARVQLDRHGNSRTEEAFLNFVYQPLFEHGQVRDILVHAVDVTDLVYSRRETQTIYGIGSRLASELDLTALAQSVTDATTRASGAEIGAFFYNVVDEQGQSRMLYTLAGASKAIFENYPLPRSSALFAPTFRGAAVLRLDDVFEDPRFGVSPPYYGLPEGHPPVRSYLAVPVVTRGGEFIGGLFFGHSATGVFTDRTERMVVGIAAQAAIAMENAHLYREIQVALRTRDEFLSAVAHDLKSPLTSVKGMSQLLRRMVTKSSDEDSDRLEQGLTSIDRAVTRMSDQLDELLDLTRMRMGRSLELRRFPTDIVELTRQVIGEQQTTTDRHRISLQAEPLTITGNWDATRLTRVVTNLLSNAIKYSPEGGDILVTLRRQDVDGHPQAVLSVQDHGVGIPVTDLSRVFERFQRASNAAGIVGSGVGLASARQIVSQHGGRLEVESSEGHGSTFTVYLPLDNSED